ASSSCSIAARAYIVPCVSTTTSSGRAPSANSRRRVSSSWTGPARHWPKLNTSGPSPPWLVRITSGARLQATRDDPRTTTGGRPAALRASGSELEVDEDLLGRVRRQEQGDGRDRGGRHADDRGGEPDVQAPPGAAERQQLAGDRRRPEQGEDVPGQRGRPP